MPLGDRFKRVIGGNVDPAREREKALAAAKAQAALVDGFIDDLNSPNELEERREFQLGVEALDNPHLDSWDLLRLSEVPAQSIWQMGVVAVARRERDPQLVGRLLELYDNGGPWHRHFVLKALLVHMPEEHSLAGETFYRLIGMEGPYLEFNFRILVTALSQRAAAGEEPAFGELLDRLDTEKADGLQIVLDAALDSPLSEVAETLRADLERWRASFVDRDVLRGIGRLWDESKAPAPPVIDHPQLALDVHDVLRTLGQRRAHPGHDRRLAHALLARQQHRAAG